MVLTGEQWLEQVLRPTVAAARRTGEVAQVLGSRLAAQVEALAATGVLTDEQRSAAVGSLEEAGIMPVVRSRSVSVSSSSSGGMATAARTGTVASPVPAPVVEPPRLLTVSPGPHVLGQLDGRPVHLVSAELWSSQFLLDLYVETTPEERATYQAEGLARLERARRASRGEATERHPRTHALSRLQSLQWELRDEQDTAYLRTGDSGQRDEHLDRLRISWRPAPPAGIGRLTVVAIDSDGASAFSAVLPG